jgi:bisanhydrobacterioruberin hydratase
MKLKIILYLIFLFGVLWHIIPGTKPLVMEMTPLVLLLSYIIIIYPEIKLKNYNTLIWVLAVSVATYLIEVVGVNTSMIFGEYVYGDTLGVKLLGVPLVIGINWAFIIFGSSEIVMRIPVNKIVRIFMAASLAVMLDFLIEPVAVYLDYWRWENNIIPVQNYAAWFILALIISSSYQFFRIRSKSSLPVHFFITQVLFFGSLNIFMD